MTAALTRYASDCRTRPKARDHPPLLWWTTSRASVALAFVEDQH